MVVWNFKLLLFICSLILEGCASLTDITYEGRKYVAEGQSFIMSCMKSSYGIPKWSRNGLAIDPSLDPDYVVVEENLPNDKIRIELKVKMAGWRHRGEYKCDSLNSNSHLIEIVPSRESDQEMCNQARVQLRPNRTLKLVCDQEENVVFPINWYKDGKRILESEEDTRIRMEGRTLLIAKSNEGDAGEYMCVIEMSGLSYPFADHLGTRIKVTYASRVENFPTQIRPILNRNLSMECQVQGFPIPRVEWFVDGFPIEEYRQNDSRYGVTDNSQGLPKAVFVIRDVKYGDNHQVTCIADNLDGSAETATLLAVRENAITTNEEEQGKGIILTPGHDLLLQCNNTDGITAEISWLKDGKQLNLTDARVQIIAANNSLLITNTVESDCGNYTCKGGGDEAVIAVRSMVKIGPLDHSRNVVQNQNIVLLCNVTQGTPAPTLTWLKDDVPLNLSDPRVTTKADARGIEGTELIIADAQFEDRASYTCHADNGFSSVNVTILVRVKDKYAALWPFLGICAEVAVLCTIIFIYEKRRQKPDFDESETEHNTENKSVPDSEDKSRDVRQRK